MSYSSLCTTKLYLLLVLLAVSASCGTDEVNGNVSTNSTISTPLTSMWLGFGYNQDPLDRDINGHDIESWNVDHWNLTVARMNFIKPSLVRVVLYRRWFNSSGVVGDYNWESPSMLSLYKVLDYYKSKNIPVMTGLWQSTLDANDNVPFYTSEGDNSFQKLQVDMFHQLYIVKGYDNIRWYTPTNEPKGMNMDFDKWSWMMNNTYAGFSDAKLPLNLFCGADSWDEWTLWAATYNKNVLSGYDHHFYLNAGIDQVLDGSLEVRFRKELAGIKAVDNSNKPLFLSEVGFSSSVDYWYVLNPVPSYNPTSTKYGMVAFDYGIQVARSGESGALAWSFDGYDYGKDPGMWNISGNNGGTTLRPWYYSWSMLCRYFPSGGTIYPIEFDSPSTRGVAIEVKVSEKSHWTFAFINLQDTEVKTKCSIPGVGGGEFTMFQLTESTIGDGVSYSVPGEKLTVKSVNDGFEITLPANGGVVITSMEGLPFSRF